MLQASHLSPRTIQHLLTSLAEEVAQALARGESYTIPGIGTISTKELRSKSTSNLVVGDGDPMGEHITPARRKIKFRAELDLLRRANGLSAPGSLPVVR